MVTSDISLKGLVDAIEGVPVVISESSTALD